MLEKGKPEDAMPGLVGSKQALPNAPLNGMINKKGEKVRLTFKLEEDSLWIGTKGLPNCYFLSNIIFLNNLLSPLPVPFIFLIVLSLALESDEIIIFLLF